MAWAAVSRLAARTVPQVVQAAPHVTASATVSIGARATVAAARCLVTAAKVAAAATTTTGPMHYAAQGGGSRASPLLGATERRRDLSTAAAACHEGWGPTELRDFVRDAMPSKDQKSGKQLLYPGYLGDLLDGSHLHYRDGVNTAALATAVGTRCAAITAVAAGFSARRDARDRAGGGDAAQASVNNPLVAAHGAPCAGKTMFTGILAALSSASAWTPDLCADADMRATLNASVPIYVKYNHDRSPNALDENVDVGLAMSILEGFFTYTLSSSSCKKLYDRFSWPVTVTAKEAVACCLQVAAEECPAVDGAPARTGLLLLVDQIAWLYHSKEKQGQECNLLEVIGGLLDAFPSSQLNVLVTTVDTQCTARLATSVTQKRNVVYAPLAPLPQEVVEAMFLAAWHKKLRAGTAGTAAVPVEALPAALPHYMRVAVSDTCGVPFSLLIAKDVWLGENRGRSGPDPEVSAVEVAHKAVAVANAAQQVVRLSGTPDAIAAARDAAVRSYDTQKKALAEVRHIVCRHNHSVDQHHIAAALAGRALPLDDPPPGATQRANQTLRQLITDGKDVNTMADGAAAAVIPHVTVHKMLNYVGFHREERWYSKEWTTSYQYDRVGARTIMALANSAMDAVNPECAQGKWFAEFLVAWMRLVAGLQPGAPDRSLADVWHVEGVAAGSPLAAPLQLPIDEVVYKTHNVQIGHATQLQVDAIHTFVPTTHPGCDFACVVHTPSVALTSTKEVAAAAATPGVKIVVGWFAVQGSQGATIRGDIIAGRCRVAGVETVGEVARSLRALDDRKLAIKDAVAVANGVSAKEVGVVYIHVAGSQSLYAAPGATLPSNPTREQLAEYMREAEADGSEDLVRLSCGEVDAFVAAVAKYENAIIVDSARFATALSPTLASYGQFMLRLLSEQAAGTDGETHATTR